MNMTYVIQTLFKLIVFIILSPVAHLVDDLVANRSIDALRRRKLYQKRRYDVTIVSQFSYNWFLICRVL